MRSQLAALALTSLLSAACPAGTCVEGGRSYRAGETFPSADGCNTCTCLEGGGVACTERACLSGDLAGAPPRDLTGEGGPVSCTGLTSTFPTFPKTCAGAGDCAIGLHQFNCCGSIKALGLRQSDLTRFTEAETLCRSQYPRCGCPTLPPVAEDGKSAPSEDRIAVECRAGACTTYVR